MDDQTEAQQPLDSEATLKEVGQLHVLSLTLGAHA